MKVLFIIVSYNGMAWLERCLGSVVAQSAVAGGQGDAAASSVAGTQVDLFVVDNDSTDGSADFVEARFPQVRLMRCAENLGFTAANNLGFAEAMRKGYDYVYLLNQDAWLEEGALAALLEAAVAHPEYAVLSPLQLQADGLTLDPKFGKLMKRACVSVEGAQGKRISGALFSGPENFFPVRDEQAREIIPLPFVMAAHWLVPVKALQEIGTFSELFPIYGQDDNWCDRARYHGWKIGVVPLARAIHDRSARSESKERILERNYRNAALVRLADINRPLWTSWLYVCLLTPVQALKYRSWAPFRLFSSLCRQNTAIVSLRQETR
ncbi:MAG: glycosyltransferase family 2 protein [Bacteroidales bacterium]|nr:glycosyltransferase family 2 protein [Bacteroidales bacterium]